MSEKQILNDSLVQASKLGLRLFRNNTGTGWTGDEIIRMTSDSLMIKNPRPLRAGLVKGSSDCVGWTPILITPEMVGKSIAVFTAFEMKDQKGRVSEDQKIFLGNVEQANGIVGVIRAASEIEKEIDKWRAKILSI